MTPHACGRGRSDFECDACPRIDPIPDRRHLRLHAASEQADLSAALDTFAERGIQSLRTSSVCNRRARPLRPLGPWPRREWDDGGGREAVFVSRQFSLRNAIPRAVWGVGPPDRRSFAAAVDQTDAANAVGQCASGVSGQSAVPQQDTDRNAMKTALSSESGLALARDRSMIRVLRVRRTRIRP